MFASFLVIVSVLFSFFHTVLPFRFIISCFILSVFPHLSCSVLHLLFFSLHRDCLPHHDCFNLVRHHCVQKSISLYLCQFIACASARSFYLFTACCFCLLLGIFRDFLWSFGTLSCVGIWIPT